MLILVIGGAGSGKSAYAESLALSRPGKHCYIATMEPFGAEAEEKIRRHHALRRGKGFETVECYVNLDKALVPLDSVVLLEDLPNLAANERFGPRGGGIQRVFPSLIRLSARCRDLVIVTGELLTGGRDYAGDTLSYLEDLGTLHRQIASMADTVIEVVCGLPNFLKGEVP